MKTMRIALSCALLALADATVPPPSSGPTPEPPARFWADDAAPHQFTFGTDILSKDRFDWVGGDCPAGYKILKDYTECEGAGGSEGLGGLSYGNAGFYRMPIPSCYTDGNNLFYNYAGPAAPDGQILEETGQNPENFVYVCTLMSCDGGGSGQGGPCAPVDSLELFCDLYDYNEEHCTAQVGCHFDTETEDCSVMAPPDGTCNDPFNLDTMTSPYSGTTQEKEDNFGLHCGGQGNEQVFRITVAPMMTLLIGQTQNSFDSKHQLQYGDCGTIPPAANGPPGVILLECRDDPDDEEEQWTNKTGQAQDVFFTIDSYGYGGSGTFTLAWRITDWPFDFNTFLTDEVPPSVGWRHDFPVPNGSTSGLLMFRGRPVCDATFQREDGVTACNELGMGYIGHKRNQEIGDWTEPPTDMSTYMSTEWTTDAPTDASTDFTSGEPRRRRLFTTEDPGPEMSSTAPPTEWPRAPFSTTPVPMDSLAMGRLRCAGTEDGLADCSENTRCDESDTGVKLFCHAEREGAAISEEGFLMYDGEYVCDDGWGINDAIGSGSYSSGSAGRRLMGSNSLYYGSEYDAGSSGDWWRGDYNLNVVCRELGFSSVGGSWVGNVQLPSDTFGMDELDCQGDEARLADCPHNTSDNCGSDEGIQVSCGAKLTYVGRDLDADGEPTDGFCQFSENCDWMQAMMDRIQTLERNLAAVASGGIWLEYCDMFVSKIQNKHYAKCRKMRVNDRYNQTKKESKCAKMEFCDWGPIDGAEPTCNYICPSDMPTDTATGSSVPGDMPTTGPTDGGTLGPAGAPGLFMF